MCLGYYDKLTMADVPIVWLKIHPKWLHCVMSLDPYLLVVVFVFFCDDSKGRSSSCSFLLG